MTLFAGEVSGSSMSRRTALYDSLFLAAVVLLSCLPYTRGLGLYSDDWAILSALHNAEATFSGRLAAIMPMHLATRPVQGLVLAGLYSVFGLDPVGYHIVNGGVLVAAVLLFYLSLRALGLTRPIALTVPLVFGLLPHYSTDRFWIAAFQANVSVCLYFLSLYADLRFVKRAVVYGWLWKALGTIALVGSVLAYEVTGALFLLNVLVLWYVARIRQDGKWVPQAVPTALGIGSNLVFLALTIGYKLTTTVRADISGGFLYRVLRIVREAAPVHFFDYGLAIPVKVGRVLRDYPDGQIIAASVLVGLVVFTYLLRNLARPVAPLDRSVSWTAVMLIGAVLFVAGNGVALMTWEVGFHTTGANNRTAIGAAIGVSWVFAGAIGWLSSRLSSSRHRLVSFCLLIALLAASSTVLTNTVANFWLSSARQQQAVIAAIQQEFPQLRSGSTLLLDGLCPFVGPAPVFATGWDVTGMLQLTYNDYSLRGDVVKPNTEVTPTGIRTMLFDDVINLYPYGERLVIYHVRTGEHFAIGSSNAAREYFANTGGSARTVCPPYTDGDGAAVF